MDIVVHIEWCKDDIENALAVNGYDISEENVCEVLGMIDTEKLMGVQVDAGWKYIYSLIADAAEKNLLK